MYLKEGCSLLLKKQKPLVPFVLNTINPLQNELKVQNLLKESDVLNKLKNEPNILLALHFFKSIANSKSFKHTPLTYTTMIKRLGYERDIDGIQYLLQLMKLEGISCNEDLFVIVINAYRRVGLAEQALKTFYRIGEFGCKPSVKIYNHVLDALLSENKFQMITGIYNNMKRDGIELNVYTYNMLLKALWCIPDAVSYTTVVSSMCRLGKVEEARELSMRIKSFVPVYNALINGFCREHKMEEVFELFNEMAVEGIDPNVITYSTVINTLSVMGNVELALAVLAKMFSRGCSPNVHTFTSLMKGYFLGGRLCEALDLWNRMIKKDQNPTLSGICFSKNGEKRCLPNETTYSTLIDALRKLVTWLNMANGNCPPNTITFNTFIKGLCCRGKIEWAMTVLNQMGQYGCAPNATTYNELLDGLFNAKRTREALQIVGEMEEMEIKSNLVTYNTILSGFCHAGMFKGALQIVGKMLVGGAKPDSITYNTVIYAYCTQGDVKTAIQLVDKLSNKGEGYPDVFTYTSLLWGACNWIGVDEAIFYLDKMINEGICPNRATWNALVRGLFSKLGHLGPIHIVDDILANGKVTL
ncbi:pentatricopeptide repeat-containing protein [Salix suchowensis]|nr:pentatricopeptide repeat-containing protein [Salix suchowensis]